MYLSVANVFVINENNLFSPKFKFKSIITPIVCHLMRHTDIVTCAFLYSESQTRKLDPHSRDLDSVDDVRMRNTSCF